MELLRDLYECSHGAECRPATDRGWPCQEATRLEAAEAAPGSGSPAQAIAGLRSTKSPLTSAPLAAAADGGRRTLDDESRDWLHSLSVDCSDEALDRLRTFLLRATRFEVARRRDQLLHVDDSQLDELARTAADAAALCAVAHLDRYRGGSRFTTWAAKFGLLEAAIQAERAGLARDRTDARCAVALGTIFAGFAGDRGRGDRRAQWRAASSIRGVDHRRCADRCGCRAHANDARRRLPEAAYRPRSTP